MSLKDGRYLIVSEHPESGHLDFVMVAHPIFPEMYFIVGSQRKDLKEQWRVTRMDHGWYTIYSTSHPRAAWALRPLRDDKIVASAGQRDWFSIEPAGEGTYRIHVSNGDLVATLERAGHEQLHVEPERGEDFQRWRFVPMNH